MKSGSRDTRLQVNAALALNMCVLLIAILHFQIVFYFHPFLFFNIEKAMHSDKEIAESKLCQYRED